eukprot:4062135-Pyramimonas_sp.AAC.1
MAKPRRGAASGGQPQTKVAKKASEEKPQRPANKWMNVRAATCTTCHQNTHVNDRDSTDGSPLFWPKSEVLKSGERAPMGHECGVCAYVRGKYYPRGTSQKDLGDKINSSEEEASRHARLRKDRASGENKCQETEAVNVKHTSQ